MWKVKSCFSGVGSRLLLNKLNGHVGRVALCSHGPGYRMLGNIYIFRTTVTDQNGHLNTYIKLY